MGNKKKAKDLQTKAIRYELYCGLENDLKLFAQIILLYEIKIKNISSFTELSKKLPKSAIHFKKNIQAYLATATIDQIMGNKEFFKKGKTTLIFTNSKYQFHSFIRHIRNSFCHGLIKKDNGEIIIEDKIKRKGHTCKGYINYTDFIEFAKILILEYENDANNK